MLTSSYTHLIEIRSYRWGSVAGLILRNKVPTDAVILAGDFNCESNTDTVKELKKSLALDASDNSFGGSPLDLLNL